MPAKPNLSLPMALAYTHPRRANFAPKFALQDCVHSVHLAIWPFGHLAIWPFSALEGGHATPRYFDKLRTQGSRTCPRLRHDRA